MGEKRKLFSKTVEYNGLVDLKAFGKEIQEFMKNQGYKAVELEYEESSHEDSRSFKQKLQIDTKPSDYVKNVFKVKYSASKIKDVEVQRANHKVILQEAKVKVEIEGIIETDYSSTWSLSKNWFFIKTILNQFFLTEQLEPDNALLIKTGEALTSRLKTFLNLYQY